jgi:hypothetical protein
VGSQRDELEDYKTRQAFFVRFLINKKQNAGVFLSFLKPKKPRAVVFVRFRLFKKREAGIFKIPGLNEQGTPVNSKVTLYCTLVSVDLDF